MIAELPDERETAAVPKRRRSRPKQLDAGPFAADVASFRLHLAAENKADGTIRIYTEAPLWSPPPTCSARRIRPGGSR